MRLMPSTLAGRLFAMACLFVTIALLLAGTVIAVILHYVVTDQVDQRLRAQAASLAAALSLDAGGRLLIAPGLDAPPFDRLGSGWYWQVESGISKGVADNHPRSRSLGSGSLQAPPQPFDWRTILSGRAPTSAGRDGKGRVLHVLTVMATVGSLPVTISVSSPNAAITDPLKRALLWLIPSVGSLGLALLGATLLQVRLGLRPLRALRDAVHAVRSGHQDRIPAAQPEELLPIAVELNALLAENEARLANARLHLANMAHSLKTPLASLSLAVRESGRDPGDPLIALTDQIEARIRHHLGRARSDAGAGHRRSQTDIAAHLADLTGIMQKIYADRAIALALSVGPELKIACEAQDFDELAGNLIDNAFKWARTRVSVSAAASQGTIRFVIEDDGPGIPQTARRDVVLPGRRLDEAVPGHGFGLSVAQELISLYGGTLDLEAAESGGLRAVVTLPSAS